MKPQRSTKARHLSLAEPPKQPAFWMTVEQGAVVLAMSSEALRRSLERKAVRAPDGGVEASWDGIRGRKLGRLWRVSLSERWMNDAAEVTSVVRGGAAQGQEAKRP